MVPAICTLHNFICIHDADDLPVVTETDGMARAYMGQLGGEVSSEERNRATELRESIAQAMWESYQNILNVNNE
jgi:hypothetical protein